MKHRLDETVATQIMVEGVTQEDVSKYGFIVRGAVSLLAGGRTASMTRMIKKNKHEDDHIEYGGCCALCGR